MGRGLGPVAILALAGCYQPDVALGIPCSDTGQCPDGQECDPIAQVCTLPTEQLIWRDDTAADFAQPDAVYQDAIVEAAGFVGPTPYLTGSVRLAGIGTDLLGGAPASVTWEQLAAATVAGRGFDRTLDLNYFAGAPRGVGLTADDNVTVLVETEIELDAAGDWRLRLIANDSGFIDIAPPGGDFTRLVSDLDIGTVGTVSVATAGWYRVRGAFSDAGGNLSFDLEIDPPGGSSSFVSIPLDKLRAPVGDLVGFHVDGFDEVDLLQPRGAALTTDTVGASLFTSNAYELPIGAGSYTLRWAGQVLIDVDGQYAFRLDSSQGHRAWLDGLEIANDFGSSSAVTVTTPARLDPGWHDLVIDVEKVSGSADGRLALTVASGPMWAGEALPLDHVRPAVGRAQRWVGDFSSSTQAIPDAGTTAKTVSFGLPSGITPIDIEAGYVIDHPLLDSVGVVLDPVNGSDVTLASPGALTGGGTVFRHASIPTSRLGTSWAFEATDGVTDTMTGAIELGAITVRYSGGMAPFPTTFRYESAVRDLGDVVGMGPLTWGLRQGSAATVRFRTCDQAAACASEAWVDVASGETPNVPPRRFAQYSVAIGTDGDVPTALDWIEVAYSARPELAY